MCGAPPLAGFISKWHVALGAVGSDQFSFLAVICTGSLLDVVYFFPVIRTAFFGSVPQAETLSNEREPKVTVYSGKRPIVEYQRPIYLFLVIPLAITALVSIGLCFFPNALHIYDLARTAVAHIFGGR